MIYIMIIMLELLYKYVIKNHKYFNKLKLINYKI